ncbi:MAG: hypothetical protein IJO73_02490 [Clostridia bacterium]|nr:hypothetical protein [Clostridia bacterium]
MFENIGTFSALFWALAVVLLLLILFEKKLIAFEDRWREVRKKKIRKLEKQIALQNDVMEFMDELICEQFCYAVELKRKLKAQERINEINLEDLRQERLKNNREVKE